MPFYIIKDKNSPEAQTPPMFIEKDKVEKILTYSDMLYREIALRTDSMAYYDRAITSGKNSKSNLKNLLKHNYIYDSDMDVSDRYIKEFNEEFDSDINYQLYKCYYDIEVDLMPNGFKDRGFIGFPNEEDAPCPVNIITLIDSRASIAYTFIVNNKENNSQQEFIKNYVQIPENYKKKIEEIKNFIFERNRILLSDIRLEFFNSEEECIEAFFRKVHEIDPDVMAAYNAGFDIQTLINRLTKLYSKKREYREQGIRGFDKMLSVVCDQKYMIIKNDNGEDIYLSPKAYYKQNKGTKIVDRMDEFTVLDGIFWADQMLLYANVRKSTIKESYSLDAIAGEELGSEKLDYTGYTIKNLAWKNFERFLTYNIFDVVLLDALEKKNLDIDMVQKLSEVTNTRKYKVFKKTISIKNFVCKFAESQNYIMGNNKNADYGDDGAYFEAAFLNKKQVIENDPVYLNQFAKKENFGAYVGDPNLNEPNGIKDPSNRPSKFLFENVFDEDFSSLYPSIIRAYNLDKNTLVGKFFWVDSEVKNNLMEKYDYDNSLFAVSKNEEGDADSSVSTNDVALTLVDSLISKNWEKIGEKYFNLPSTIELTEKLKKTKENNNV